MATTTAPARDAAVPGALGPFTVERPRAPWGLRALAVLLDSAIVATVAFLATGDAPEMAALPGLGEAAAADGAPWTAGTLLVLGVLQAYTGMTPGKRATGICVVDDTSGRPIGLLGTVVRWLAHLLDAILVIGYLRAAWHREGRTFADSLLGTVAVRTTRPEPHPWVARLRDARDQRVSWLRWPARVTGGLALAVCAASAAASVFSGSGGGWVAADDETVCTVTEPAPLTAMIETSRSARWETRLGISRTTEETWHVVAGWTDEAPGTADDGPGALPADVRAIVTVTSPDGSTPEAAPGDDPGTGPSSSMPGTVVAAAQTQTPEDVTGWTATTSLLGDDGDVLAECSGTIPAIDANQAAP